MTRNPLDFFVLWDNSNGTDDDRGFGSCLAAALRFYNSLPASVPFKKITVTDDVHGERNVVTSKGEDNIDKLHLRYLVW